MSTTLVNALLKEKSGQILLAEIYSNENEYLIKYFINGNFQNQETFTDKNIQYVEDAAQNWIDGIKVLNG